MTIPLQPNEMDDLRDWLAGQAAAAMAQHMDPDNDLYPLILKRVAKVSYDLADALLRERERR